MNSEVFRISIQGKIYERTRCDWNGEGYGLPVYAVFINGGPNFRFLDPERNHRIIAKIDQAINQQQN